MAKLVSMMKQLFSPIQPLPAGIYNYTSPADDPRNYRLHLRLKSDGSGVMIVNASSVLHLNQTAAEYAYYLVKNESRIMLPGKSPLVTTFHRSRLGRIIKI